MASAVLANRATEPNWASPSQPQPNRANYMGKLPSFSNPNPKLSSKKRQVLPPLPVLEIDDGCGGGVLAQSAASDDASSINRRPSDLNLGGHVTFNVASYTKKELVELKARLISELERIHQLKNRIESSDLRPSKKPVVPPAHGKKGASNLSGNKRPFPPAGPASKRGGVAGSMNPTERAAAMKKCGQILSKLMKHKFGYVFNSPVDVVGMQLHDYYDIIKCPMDLGAVKSKLAKNAYGSPKEFAADVRLTFNNAMRYNPIGHEVYALAEQLLARFEDLYKPISQEERVEPELEEEVDIEEEDRVREVEASSWDHGVEGVDGELGRKDLVGSNPFRSQNQSLDSFVNAGAVQFPARTPSPPIRVPAGAVRLPVRTPSPPVRAPPVKPLKQPKPKAKDPNKREMSLEEKHKLGLGLQSLPPEKMEQVVGIIKKRNGHLTQDGDEIELDIEVVDTETLWELDRFVTNYKKAVSKLKRQGLIGINSNGPAAAATSEANKDMPMNERSEVVAEVKKAKKGDAGDEDVDIGDEMPMSSFPPVEIEKDNGHASSSSSSSSSSSDDSSSSSGSDSGSSSGSDSEDVHS